MNFPFKIEKLKPLVKYGNAGALPQILWKLKGFDIIHLHYPFYGTAEFVWLLKKMKNKKTKLVITYHQDPKDITRGVGLNRLFTKIFILFHSKFITPHILKSADKVIATTYDYILNTEIRKDFIKNHDRFIEIPPEVDTKTFRPARKDKSLIKKYGFCEKDVIIIFVAALDTAHRFKGLLYLINSLSSLPKNVKLLIVGDGDLRRTYEEYAYKRNLAKRVVFVGKIKHEELPKYYNLADLFILPSEHTENFGLVFIEAMACEKPVIATDLVGVRKVVDNGINGLIIKPKSHKEIVYAIKKFLKNKKLIKMYGINGRKKVETYYDSKIISNKLNNLYSEVFYE